MLKIKNYSSISDFRKYELSEILESISGIIASHNPESLGVNGMYELLIAQRAEVNKLKEEPKGFPLQTRYKALGMQRDKLVVAIMSGIRAIDKAALSTQTEKSIVVIPTIRRYLHSFRKLNLTEKLEKSAVLLKELDTTECNVALEALGLKVYFDELKLLQTELTELATGSKNMVIGFRKSHTQSVKRAVTGAIRNMFKAIELAAIDHPDKDYSELIHEINNYLSNYSIAAKARKTRKVNALNNATVASTPTSTATAS